jgi:hypothetical protein
MTIGEARRWLAIYFLLATAVIGSFLLFFSGTSILLIEKKDGADAFQIIIPVLVGQLTVVFQWLANADRNSVSEKESSPIPDWSVWLPPTLSLAIIAAGAISLKVANAPAVNSSVSPETFKNAITFSVTLLNASTVFLVARLFAKSPRTDAAVQPGA